MPDDPAARTFGILPAALRRPDDLFVVSVSAGPPVSDPEAPRSFRTAALTTRTPAALTVELPAAVAAPTVVARATPSVQLDYAFHNPRDGLAVQAYRFLAKTVVTDPFVVRAWSAEVSSAWLGGADEITYGFPDLSAMPGITTGYGLSPGVPIRWVFSRVDQNQLPDVGRVVRTSSITGTSGG